jgi:hypothetical protein
MIQVEASTLGIFRKPEFKVAENNSLVALAEQIDKGGCQTSKPRALTNHGEGLALVPTRCYL